MPLPFAVILSKSESATGLKAAEWLLIVSGLILVWGAIGEYIEDHEKLHKLPRWLRWKTLVFVLMVVGGLIGEFVGDAGVFVCSEALQAFEDHELTRLGVTETALENKLKTVNDTADNAVSASKEALTVASGAKQHAADAASHLGEAVSMAKAEETELRKLEEQVAPRTLTADQMRSIRDRLLMFRGHPAVVVSSYGQDGEGAAVATEIISIIASATGVMPVNAIAQTSVTGGFEQGVQIRGPASEEKFMAALAVEFNSTKLKPAVINGPSFRSGVTTGGNAVFGGTTTKGGGGGVVEVSIPISGPVAIHVGIKPIPVLTFQ